MWVEGASKGGEMRGGGELGGEEKVGLEGGCRE